MKTAILFAEGDKSSLENFTKDATAIYAVANNRLNNKKRWGYNSIEEVVTDTSQFSGYMSNEYMKAFTGNVTEEEEKYIKKALQIIKGYDSGLIEDPTGNADHYYNLDVADPEWGKLDTEEKVRAGNKFYPETYRTAHSFRKETTKKSKRQKKIQEVQRLLNNQGYKLEEDGILGELTTEAIKSFQASKGLVVDGKAGRKTMALLTDE